MNKTDLIDVVSDKLGDRRTASLAVEAVVDTITRAVARGEKVGISGFGVFEKVERAPRTARNPTTGEAVKLKRTTVPKFRPGQGFKDIVSGAKKVSPVSGDRAVTARAGVPRKAAAGTGGATAPVRKAPARTARATATTPARPLTAGKAPAKAVRAPAKAAGSAARAAGRAPAGRTVAAPGAARSAAAANAPGRAKVAKRT